jgi:hypothetical protein
MKWKSSYVIPLLGFLVTLVLAFTPFFPQTKGWWHLDQPDQFYSVLAAFIGVDMALVILIFGLMFAKESNALRAEITQLIDRVPATTIRWLPDRVFYRAFLAAAEEARHTVRISYFAPDPPNAVAAPVRAEYYKDITSTMHRRKDVQFYRLVRYSPANEDWLLDMVREFTDVANVSLAVINQDLEPGRVMPLALSVQVVDDTRAWLVAVEAHERMGEFRDLYVENAHFADAMNRYHLRLWAIAEPLLLNGRPTDAAGRMTSGVRRENT